MIRCPFCNQPMVGVTSEDGELFTDLYRCGACQVEQAVYWEHGERLLSWEKDPEE
mgnify:FL=1